MVAMMVDLWDMMSVGLMAAALAYRKVDQKAVKMALLMAEKLDVMRVDKTALMMDEKMVG